MKKLIIAFLMVLTLLFTIIPTLPHVIINADTTTTETAVGKVLSDIVPDPNLQKILLTAMNKDVNNPDITLTQSDINKVTNVQSGSSDPITSTVGLNYFKNIGYISLNRTNVQKFPDEIFDLPRLNNISFMSNDFMEGPIADKFNQIPLLTVFDFNLNGSKKNAKFVLPNSFYDLPMLNKINMSNSPLNHLGILKNASKMVRTNFYGSYLTQLPANMLDYTGEINFGHNNLTTLSLEEYDLFNNNFIANLKNQSSMYTIDQPIRIGENPLLSDDSVFDVLNQVRARDNVNISTIVYPLVSKNGDIVDENLFATIDDQVVLTDQGVVAPFDALHKEDILKGYEHFSLRLLVKDKALMNSVYTFNISLDDTITRKVYIKDKETGDVLFTDTISGSLGQAVDYKFPSIPGFASELGLESTSVDMNSSNDITFEFTRQKQVITVYYRDTDGKDIKDSITIEGLDGSPYVIEVPVIEGYGLKDSQTSIKGNFDGTTVIVITYVKSDNLGETPEPEQPGNGTDNGSDNGSDNNNNGNVTEDNDSNENDTNDKENNDGNHTDKNTDKDKEISQGNTNENSNNSNKDKVLPSTGVSSDSVLGIGLIILTLGCVLLRKKKLLS